jgi:hypothetical protein
LRGELTQIGVHTGRLSALGHAADQKDDRVISHTVLKTIASFLNTEGGPTYSSASLTTAQPWASRSTGVENDGKFVLHLIQIVHNGLGAPAPESSPSVSTDNIPGTPHETNLSSVLTCGVSGTLPDSVLDGRGEWQTVCDEH